MSARSKPTQTQFERYAQALAATVFSDKKRISGQQLVEALPHKQLNLLVLYVLKERWEQEANAIRSPFFDYEAQPVREAQRKFLNVLSQHIQLKQDAYTQLLGQALQDAWELASRPAQFLSSLAEKLARPSITQEQMQSVAKYIVYHAELLRQALKDLALTGRTSFLKGDLHRQLQQIADRQASGNSAKYLDELAFYLDSLGVDEHPVPEPEEIQEETEPAFALEASLTLEPDPADAAIEQANEPTSWPVDFDEGPAADRDELVSNSADDVAHSVEQSHDEPLSEAAPEQWEPQSEPDSESLVIEPQSPEAHVVPIQSISSLPEHAPPVYIHPEDKEESLGDRLARQQQGQGLYTKVAAAASENLHSLIAIGDRYMMVAQLFGGDMASYSMAVSHVNGLTNLEDALHYLWDELASRHSWNPDSDAYKTLEAALRRKFAA